MVVPPAWWLVGEMTHLNLSTVPAVWGTVNNCLLGSVLLELAVFENLKYFHNVGSFGVLTIYIPYEESNTGA